MTCPNRQFQLDPAPAHPTLLVARIARDQGEVGDISRHHGTGPDEGKPADRESTQNGRVRSHRRPLADDSFSKLMFAWNVATGIDDVGEHH